MGGDRSSEFKLPAAKKTKCLRPGQWDYEHCKGREHFDELPADYAVLAWRETRMFIEVLG